ncbi:MAG: hypothetical protein KAT04_07185 [Methylococcales bacterium]|nr:hypothetical protein [Methylococcales bacterium]
MNRNSSSKSLAHTNKHLQKGKESKKMRVRSIASSTAIETGESIADIEAKINQQQNSHYSVTLA